MTKIKLIALDIDGTLLDDDKEIPEENVKALQEARRAGIHVAISSGRMLPSIEPVESRLGIDAVIIAYNGGKVLGTRSEGRPMIVHRPVDQEVAAQLIDYSREAGFVLNFYYDDRLYAEDNGTRRQFMELYSGRTGSRYHVTDLSEWKGKAPTKLILLMDPGEIDGQIEQLAALFGDRVALSRSDPEYLEIMGPGVNKGTALPALAAHVGLTTAEVLAVGDADNDNQMLEVAGLGVAVANARPTTKAVADIVTERTNNEGAVAEAIHRFVLS